MPLRSSKARINTSSRRRRMLPNNNRRRWTRQVVLPLFVVATTLAIGVHTFFYAPPLDTMMKAAATWKGQARNPEPRAGNQKRPLVCHAGGISSTSKQFFPFASLLGRRNACCGNCAGSQGPCTGSSWTALPASALEQMNSPAASAEEHLHVGTSTREVHVMVVIPGNGARSDKLQASWTEIMEHMSRRMQFVDELFHLHIATEEEIMAAEGGGEAALQAKLPDGVVKPDILYFLGIQSPAVSHLLHKFIAKVRHVISLDSCATLNRGTRIGPAIPFGPLAAFWRMFPLPTERKRLLTLFDTVKGFWERGHSDDILYMFLVVINGVVTDIPSVSEILKPVTFRALQCMIFNCGKEIVDCQRNPTCKAALQCLERCPPNDQVCRYRCIVQYETKDFSAFALCILQKHNCLKNHAVMPSRPDPLPLPSFRGEPMTHEIAEEISFGHLGAMPWSWKVIAGQNPAYDFFPAQHMSYFKKGKQMWYQPVFKVITHDGKEVWRKRQYRVRRAKQPGTFYYTVLDNGVTSAEYWRIIDAAEDMSWVLFYYTGAAAAAGQSYAGAILASTRGDFPPNPETYMERIHQGLDRCGIKPWELFKVKHEGGSVGAPLEIDPLAEGRFIFPNSTAVVGAAFDGFVPANLTPAATSSGMAY